MEPRPAPASDRTPVPASGARTLSRVGLALLVAALSGVLRLHADRLAIAAAERRVVTSFTSGLPRVPVTEVEAMATDVHDLDDLRRVGAELARPTAAA